LDAGWDDDGQQHRLDFLLGGVFQPLSAGQWLGVSGRDDDVGGVGGGLWFFRDVVGNCYSIANLVATGQLDTYLAQPKPVLLHVLVSRMSVSAIGDVLFGLILYALFGDLTWIGFVKFAVALLLSTLFFTFFTVLTQSLAFYIGNAEGLGYQFLNTFLTFATYPTDIFRGLGRLVLFTVIPAGFISYLPIGLLREFQIPFMLGAVGAVVLLMAGGIWAFDRGLKRYGSGNMMTVRM
jgi:ABC-2 type transport system permease protein